MPGNAAAIETEAAPRSGRRGRPSNEQRGIANDRRARILEAATARFAEFGFRATTVRQIADDVGLGSGSLFHHFATKEEMLGEIVRPAVRRLRDEADRISALPVDPERRLVALIHGNLAEVTMHEQVHAILYNERKLFRRTEDFADVVEARKAAYLDWNRIIHDGIAAGLFRADFDRFLTISTIVRMLMAAADWFRSHEEGAAPEGAAAYDLDRLSEFYGGFILSALRLPERAAEPVPLPREAAPG